MESLIACSNLFNRSTCIKSLNVIRYLSTRTNPESGNLARNRMFQNKVASLAFKFIAKFLTQKGNFIEVPYFSK